MGIEQDIVARKAELAQEREHRESLIKKRKSILALDLSQELLEASLDPKNIEIVNLITQAVDDLRVEKAIAAIWKRDYRNPDVPMIIVKTYPEITVYGVTDGIIETNSELKGFPIPEQQFALYEPLVFSVYEGQVEIQALYEIEDGIFKKTQPLSIDTFYINVVEFLARNSSDKPITGTPMLDIFDIEYE